MTNKSKFLEPLAIAVAGGSTIRAAAVSIGCSESHAYHLSADPEFRLRVAAIRTEMTSAAVGRLAAGVTEAVDTLRELLAVTNEPGVRLAAARAILAAIAPLSEFAELRDRIQKMESESIRRYCSNAET